MHIYYFDFGSDKKSVVRMQPVSKQGLNELFNLRFQTNSGLIKLSSKNGYVKLLAPFLNRIYFIEEQVYNRLESFNGRIQDSTEFNLLKSGLIEKENSSFKDESKKTSQNTDIPEIAIFLSPKCNLRCKYCYNNKWHAGEEINFNFVKKGINFAQQDSADLKITFHGGGEPTMSLPLMKRTIDYAKSRTDNLYLSMSTNGVFNRETCDWIIKNFSGIDVSCDGPPHIQDAQRPTAGNGKSSAIVEKTIKQLVKDNFEFEIRSTISKFSCPLQTDLVEYFNELGCTNLHFEPLFEFDNCKEKNKYASAPEPNEFIQNFISAKELCDDYGIQLSCSYVAVGKVRDRFCGAAGKNICLTSDGFISSCYEAPFGNPQKNCFPELIYGRYAPDQKISIDTSKLKTLKKRKSINMPVCSECLFASGCGGFCLSKTLTKTRNLFLPHADICFLIKKISMAFSDYIVDRHIKKEKPYFEISDKNTYFRTLRNTYFLTGKHKPKAKLIRIDDNFDFEKFESEIYEKKQVLFLVCVELSGKPKNVPDFRSRLSKILGLLKSEKKHFQILKPIPMCLLEPDEQNLNFPKNCSECIGLFGFKDSKFEVCRGVCLDDGKNIKVPDEFIRDKMFYKVKKLEKSTPDICRQCTLFWRKKCNGFCNLKLFDSNQS